jgi:hypothetical protein
MQWTMFGQSPLARDYQQRTGDATETDLAEVDPKSMA